MARLKDVNWDCGTESANGHCEAHSANHCILAVLMDIRDELKEINRKVTPLRHLDCHNFLSMPRTLTEIKRNTNRKKRTRK